MRAIMLAVGLVFAATAPSWAADRKIEDFYGRYLGQGTEMRVDPGAPIGRSGPAQKRMSEVIIEPAKGEDGFIISWSTLRSKKGNENVAEADVKTYHETFLAAATPGIFNDISSSDPLKGGATTWAHIHDNTLSIVSLQLDPSGGYFVTHYDRTLTPKGMDVHFTRIENSKIVRAVQLKLAKGDMPQRH